MLEELGASPETVIQLLVHVDTEAFVLLERIVELVGSLEPDADEEDCEQLETFQNNLYLPAEQPPMSSHLVSGQGCGCESFGRVTPGFQLRPVVRVLGSYQSYQHPDCHCPPHSLVQSTSDK